MVFLRFNRASNPFSSLTSFQNNFTVRLFFINLPDVVDDESIVSHVLSTEVDKHLLSITVDFDGNVLECIFTTPDELTRGSGGGGGGGDDTYELHELLLKSLFGKGGGGGGGKLEEFKLCCCC